MSYNDKKFGGILPTRNGAVIGGAGERSMLDRMGGSEGYRKDFRIEPNGTTTMLTTKNGQPQFQTLIDGSSTDESKNKAGLASGAVFMSTVGDIYYTRTSAVASYASPGAKIELVDRIDKTLIGTQPADKSKTTAVIANSPEVLIRCPSSIFTGKMRLYVQCLYGSLDALPAQLAMVDNGTTIPSLQYAGVPLDTSCGIYLDEATAKHYLISVTTGNAHELIRAPGVRWLEKKLLDGTISAKNKAKIEAYLLAQSYPSPPQGMDLPPRISGGLAYGWHFDWGGKNADCVGFEIVTNPGDGAACYKTTHWRISFSKVSGYITGTLSKISEGLWRNNRALRVIASPQWHDYSFAKLGFLYSSEFGSGPIYAYYSHSTEEYPGSSTIQTTAWSSAIGVTQPVGGDRSPSYMSPDPPWVLGGTASSIETWNAYSTDTLTITSCGTAASVVVSNRGGSIVSASAGVSDTPNLATDGFYSAGVPNSAFGPGPYPYYTSAPAPVPHPSTLTSIGWYYSPSGPITVMGTNGFSAGGGTYGNVYRSDPSEYTFSSATPLNATWSRIDAARSTVRDGYIIWFPLFMDAEAVYLWSRKDSVVSDSGTISALSGTGFMKSYAVGHTDVGPPTDLASTYIGYWSPLTTGTGPSTAYSNSVTTIGEVAEVLMVGGSTFSPGAPLNPAQFLNGALDTVSTYSAIQSSTRGAIYSTTQNINIGNAPLTFSGGWASYTGWA